MKPLSFFTFMKFGFVEPFFLDNNETTTELPSEPSVGRWWTFTQSGSVLFRVMSEEVWKANQSVARELEVFKGVSGTALILKHFFCVFWVKTILDHLSPLIHSRYFSGSWPRSLWTELVNQLVLNELNTDFGFLQFLFRNSFRNAIRLNRREFGI